MAENDAAIEALKDKWDRFVEPSELRHRLRRSISWLERASAEVDVDSKCILLWVAFNAAYVIERTAAREEWEGDDPKEWQLQKRYFEKLTQVEFARVHSTIKLKLWAPLDSLLKNEYVYRGFWDSLTAEPFDWKNWRHKRQFERDHLEVMKRLRKARPENTCFVLEKVFDRLSVLRNQLMHGCATKEGSLNRRQINDGVEILNVLLPLFIDIMADHPDADWGKVAYPVRDDIREDLR